MTTPRYTYFKGDLDKSFNLRAMRGYVANKQEIDKAFERFISPALKGKKRTVLDAACGIGHVTAYLKALSPRSEFLGVDQTPYLVDEAKRQFGMLPDVGFAVGDLYDLPKKFPKKFDVTVSSKVLCWLPAYEDMMRALMRMTKKHIFISSIFYDGDMDFITQVREYKKAAGKAGYATHYNLFGIPRFTSFVKSLGAKRVVVKDFEIPIDLPRKSKDVMGTYTLRLASGKRLQLSGGVPMLWKFIRVDL